MDTRLGPGIVDDVNLFACQTSASGSALSLFQLGPGIIDDVNFFLSPARDGFRLESILSWAQESSTTIFFVFVTRPRQLRPSVHSRLGSEIIYDVDLFAC